jgi:membrane protease YdiL (CAAX protease family)
VGRRTLLVVAIFFEGGLFFVALLLVGGVSAIQERISISWSATAYALVSSIPMFAALIFSLQSGWEPISRLRKDIDEKIAPIFVNSKLIDLAVIALLAGVGEELFFRGWMQDAFVGNLGVWPGIFLPSIIFGMAHYVSTGYAIYASLTGMYLGVLYHVTGNLYVVMLIHTVYDLIALIYLTKWRADSVLLEEK